MLNSVEELIAEIRNGRMVILVDDEDRENEGDLILAADHVSSESINFMASEARGLICLSLSSEQVEKLNLPQMVREEANRSPNKTAFTVSIEAAEGVSTGISTADRARTIFVASRPTAKADDITVPGHIFPIRAQRGGVLRRAGHTEASVDLMRLAGLNEAAVICEIMNADGSMARLPQLLDFARRHAIKIGSIESLIEHRFATETFIEEIDRQPFFSPWITGCEMRVFRNHLDGRTHLAFLKGNIDQDQPTLVRVQNQNVLNDVFQSEKDGSGGKLLEAAFRKIEAAGSGVVLYLLNERPDQLMSAKNLGMDQRDYGIGAQILRKVGLRKVRLMLNHPSRRAGLKGYGLEVVETIPLSSNLSPSEDLEDHRAKVNILNKNRKDLSF